MLVKSDTSDCLCEDSAALGHMSCDPSTGLVAEWLTLEGLAAMSHFQVRSRMLHSQVLVGAVVLALTVAGGKQLGTDTCTPWSHGMQEVCWTPHPQLNVQRTIAFSACANHATLSVSRKLMARQSSFLIFLPYILGGTQWERSWRITLMQGLCHLEQQRDVSRAISCNRDAYI